ncbi:hypothetical protein MLD38_031745 [Melastoma candidum]|uniref:Uncharacterized protein n=1 Tax=Melastoma candidum TaxID=119954 RepID=A0ACB9MQM3_9MYRT|nr:hypothetical protein MLD38_031745 [Melastoma candidum]
MGRAPCCEKVGLRRGKWSVEEDRLLTDYIRLHGEGHWRSLPKNAGLLRCGKSCRLRWVNYLKDDVKRGNITPAEEELIVKLHASLGNRWSVIASHMPGRTDNEVKNYWNSHLIRKVEAFFIRRRHEELGSVQAVFKCEKKKKTGGRKSRRDMKKNKGYFLPRVMPSMAINGSHPCDTASAAAAVDGTSLRSREECGGAGEVGLEGTLDFHGMQSESQSGITGETRVRNLETMKNEASVKMEGAVSGSEASVNDWEIDDGTFQGLDPRDTMTQQLLKWLWEDDTADFGQLDGELIGLLELRREVAVYASLLS